MDDDNEDDKTLSALDSELEAAVRAIEQDPVINPYRYTFTINNDQFCTDSIHGGLAPGLSDPEYTRDMCRGAVRHGIGEAKAPKMSPYPT